MSALNIRSWADFRAFLYVAWPVLSALLLSYGVFQDADEVALWSALVLAVLGPVVAFVYSKNLSSFRAAFYALFAAVQAILIGYNIVTADEIAAWIPVVSAIIGLATGGVASANTDTTPANDHAVV